MADRCYTAAEHRVPEGRASIDKQSALPSFLVERLLSEVTRGIEPMVRVFAGLRDCLLVPSLAFAINSAQIEELAARNLSLARDRFWRAGAS